MTRIPAPRRPADPLPTRASMIPPIPPVPKATRLVSLDAYRGLIMVMLASSAFGLGSMAKKILNDPKLQNHHDVAAWQTVAFQTDHVEWAGGTVMNLLRHDEASEKANHLGDWFGGGVWDLIQPSFMFMAGVAIPFSFASRRSRGESMARVWWHIVSRSFLLVALGIFLRSTGRSQTNFTFEDVLTQIGLGYPIVFLVYLIGRRVGAWPVVYLAALIVILAGYWAYFAYTPLPGADFNYESVGVPDGPWPWKDGLFAHWDKNTNAAQWFDQDFLNRFPREPKPSSASSDDSNQPPPKSEWKYNGGGYLTLNFVPSMATAIFGLFAGELLRGAASKWIKLLILLVLSAACLAAGAYAGETVCPIVKRIWTPSWAVYSAGWTFLLLAIFYGIVDCIGFRWWVFPLVVVGMNSIAMYCMESLLRGWFAKMLDINLRTPVNSLVEWINGRISGGAKIPTGDHWYSFAGEYSPIAQASAVFLVLWLICLWMYRRKIFLRI
jgi:heparan-alpha-glucosaminide N-acetyltransferase